VDLKLPGMSGIDLLAEIKLRSPSTEVIIMTSYASLETVIEAIRREAYDYIQKPFDDLDIAWITVRRALERRSLSVKNQELLVRLEEKNRELTAALKRTNSLVNAGRAMSGIGTLPELLDYFVGVAAEELGVNRVSLMLFDEAGHEMSIVAYRGFEEKAVRKIRVKPGDGIAGWVAKEGKPILVKDVRTDPRVPNPLPSAASDSFISAPIVFSIPILLQEKVLGVINVTNRETNAPFEEEDLSFLYGLAGQAAVAIERARQFEELQQAFASLKDAQKTIVHTARLKALGQMAAGIAHDFNNLLNGILGFSQILERKLASPILDLPASLADIGRIQKLSLQGAETVKRIQDFTRIRKDAPSEEVDLNAVVRNAVDVTRSRWKNECEMRGVHIEIRLDLGSIPRTTGNASELGQAVNNLIFNAVDAMPSGGTLTLRTHAEGESIHLEVSDTGVGMTREVRERLFEPFFSTKGSGQGLGTSIVYGIVARHDGEIAVSSEVGEGTRIRIRLPVAVPREERQAKIPETPMMASQPFHVLIVDDNALNRELFQAYLEPMGYRTRTAGSGAEALEILNRETVDLVVTDLGMPGMSGKQLAEQAKRIRPGLPVVLVSGWAILEEEQAMKDSGIDFLLAKPCTAEQFQQAVASALASVHAKAATAT
jgi:signal transduction histidine kinase/FixJ family two-component response regulator